MAREPLGGEDAAWLHMEDETNPMVINMVLELAGPLPPDRFAELLARLASRPRFRARMVAPKLHVGFPSWEEAADFDVAHHVEHVRLDAGDGALQTFVGGVVSTLLDTERPLWRIIVIDRPGAGTTLLVRIHHAMADGFALLGVLLSLCDDGVASEITPPIQRPGRAATAIAAAAALQRLVFLPTDPRTSLKGPLGRTKRVAWSRPLPLDAVKRVARAASATVNDVLVATAAGALARHLARQGDGVKALEIHAMVPVNLRTTVTTTSLGNRFGLVILGLPVGVSDPLARVAAVKQRMKLLKGTPEAVVTHALLRGMGWAPRPVEDLAVAFFGTKASLVLTNVPGPRVPVKIAGVTVSRLIFWVPQSGRMGLGISIFSYAGEVTIGVLADAGLLPDPEALVADLHAEFAALEAEALAEPSVRGERSTAATTATSAR